MADRISRADLDGVTRVINTRTGSPQEPHSWDENGKYAGQAGCYYIDKSNGAYALYRVCKDGHGSHDVFNARIGARDLWNRMRAFIDGLEAAELAK